MWGEMKRGEKSGKGAAEKQENLGEKLKRVGKRGGHATPVVSFWRLQLQLQSRQESQHNPLLEDSTSIRQYHHSGRGGGGGGGRFEGDGGKDSIFEVSPFQFPTVSARKLAAALWELHHYKLPLSKMHQGTGIPPPPRIRRLHHHQHHQHHHQHNIYEDKGDLQHPDPSPSSPDLVKTALFPF